MLQASPFLITGFELQNGAFGTNIGITSKLRLRVIPNTSANAAYIFAPTFGKIHFASLANFWFFHKNFLPLLLERVLCGVAVSIRLPSGSVSLSQLQAEAPYLVSNKNRLVLTSIRTAFLLEIFNHVVCCLINNLGVYGTLVGFVYLCVTL